MPFIVATYVYACKPRAEACSSSIQKLKHVKRPVQKLPDIRAAFEKINGNEKEEELNINMFVPS